ncbi:hypothetical protein [Pseudomonas sp. CVAP|uniref:antitoxin PaaA2 family protein n=1 Tax=Pseudomonas sp. CVAP\|nr:hypothetical protein [Pseudomonas sp. CVAP\
MRTHQADAYNQQLAADIQAAIDDPRPSISHEDAMAEIDAEILHSYGDGVITAAYNAWFREQVQASIDDLRPSIEDDEAKRFMAEQRDVLRRRTDR